MEKAQEHLLFTLFDNLRKLLTQYKDLPYFSITLSHPGPARRPKPVEKRVTIFTMASFPEVPPQMSKIIMLFHEDMQAEVRIGVGVRNGLHLGCILAPALINNLF